MRPPATSLKVYEFKLYSEQLRQEVERLQIAAGIQTVDLGEAPTVPLWGYCYRSEIVAWAWGTARGPEGDLHLAVSEAHRSAGLATRLALRYFCRRNSEVRAYHFTLTEASEHILRPVLVRYGFLRDADRNYRRGPFPDAELLSISQEVEDQ